MAGGDEFDEEDDIEGFTESEWKAKQRATVNKEYRVQRINLTESTAEPVVNETL